MGAADFVRNLLLGSFPNEADAIRAYKTHWLPIEKAAARAAEAKQNGVASHLEGVLDAFLKAQPRQPKKLGCNRIYPTTIGIH